MQEIAEKISNGQGLAKRAVEISASSPSGPARGITQFAFDILAASWSVIDQIGQSEADYSLAATPSSAQRVRV